MMKERKLLALGLGELGRAEDLLSEYQHIVCFDVVLHAPDLQDANFDTISTYCSHCLSNRDPNLTRKSGVKNCGRNTDCFDLSIPMNQTMLQAYNCDRQKPGEKSKQMPAEKQIYRK